MFISKDGVVFVVTNMPVSGSFAMRSTSLRQSKYSSIGGVVLLLVVAIEEDEFNADPLSTCSFSFLSSSFWGNDEEASVVGWLLLPMFPERNPVVVLLLVVVVMLLLVAWWLRFSRVH